MSDPYQNEPKNKRDEMERDIMRLRPIRYGFFRVIKEQSPPLLCKICNDEIVTNGVIVNGVKFHEGCWIKSRECAN